MEITTAFSCSTSSQKANQMLEFTRKRTECKAIQEKNSIVPQSITATFSWVLYSAALLPLHEKDVEKQHYAAL